MTTRLLVPVALLSTGLLAFGLQPAHADGAARTPDPSKLDSGLTILAAAAERGEPVTAQTSQDAGHGVKVLTGARVEDGDVLVNVYVNGSVPSAAADLRGLGMRVTATSDVVPGRVVAGWLPATKVLDATALSSAKALTVVHAGMDRADGGTDSGSVLSQGDAAHHGPQARALGATGAGVKVGVISDTINKVGAGVAGSQASGDLPANVTVLADDPQAGTIDEGRAMAEIIYDEAPGITDMAFSTGTVSAAGKAASITNLVAAGAKVIADDIFYLDEPMFQDGIVSQAVDAAKAAGVNYFASAGNRARQSWEGTMSAGADNDFDTGAPTDTIQTIGTFSGSSPYLSLQWAEPWGTATTNLSLDWYVDGVLVASPDENNVVTGIPNEFEQISFAGSHSIGIGIHRVAGAGTPKLKWIAGGATVNSIEHATNSNAINPDAASAAGSLAVAASQWSTPTTPEAFSSRGPAITRYFDKFGVLLGSPVVRPKPALAAADGVSTTVPALVTFFGTSAATPSAAGIATLLRSVNPLLTESQVAGIMTDPAERSGLCDCGSGDRLRLRFHHGRSGGPRLRAPADGHAVRHRREPARSVELDHHGGHRHRGVRLHRDPVRQQHVHGHPARHWPRRRLPGRRYHGDGPGQRDDDDLRQGREGGAAELGVLGHVGVVRQRQRRSGHDDHIPRPGWRGQVADRPDRLHRD